MTGSSWTWSILTTGRFGWTSKSSATPCPSCFWEKGRGEEHHVSRFTIHASRITHHVSLITNQMPQKKTSRPPRPTSVVTGAAGFLGSHLTDLLVARGHKVIGI